ncbi:AraC family transcriptional regulator [Rhodanobacter sp. L36]|uniref:AraC family transcriptional regulator n=1 Tax=Rhodanobacter sp. L36 TaxID=1747221 RepID=UPI00131C58B9|nr:AraC family transcriptional regulator [Rhodanobacter sp. L36]
MSVDPFSDVLDLIRAKSVVSGSLVAGGAWSIRFPPSDLVNFWGVARGECWVRIGSANALLHLEAGDFLLRTASEGAVLASDMATTPVDFEDVLASGTDGRLHHGQGEQFLMIGGKVELDAAHGAALIDALPSSIHIRHGSQHATILECLLTQLVRERTEDMPGVATASTQLAHLMFIEILRARLDSGAELAPGWLRLVGNRRLAPAVRLLHGEPARAWGLEELARECNMSRATFAVHFKADAGITPLAYLAQWRMRLAERALRDGDSAISTLGYSLGYTSESAFSNAFKRLVGKAPARYRAQARLR